MIVHSASLQSKANANGCSPSSHVEDQIHNNLSGRSGGPCSVSVAFFLLPSTNVSITIHVLPAVNTVASCIGQECFQLLGPLLRPWTFLIRARGEEIGRIAKKWTGILKESLSDTDNFAMSFPAELQPNHKGVLLGAVFLIDFVHFES